MPTKLDAIHTNLLADASFHSAGTKEERDKAAWAEAVRRYRQYLKNNVALSMAGPAAVKEDYGPDTNMGKIPPRQGPPSSLETSMKTNQFEQMDYSNTQPQNINNSTYPKTAAERTSRTAPEYGESKPTLVKAEEIIAMLKGLAGWGRIRPAKSFKVPPMKPPTPKVGGSGTPALQNAEHSQPFEVGTPAEEFATLQTDGSFKNQRLQKVDVTGGGTSLPEDDPKYSAWNDTKPLKIKRVTNKSFAGETLDFKRRFSGGLMENSQQGIKEKVTRQLREHVAGMHEGKGGGKDTWALSRLRDIQNSLQAPLGTEELTYAPALHGLDYSMKAHAEQALTHSGATKLGHRWLPSFGRVDVYEHPQHGHFQLYHNSDTGSWHIHQSPRGKPVDNGYLRGMGLVSTKLEPQELHSNIQNTDLSNIYAVATTAAKKAGYDDFTAGSPGDKKREEIVLALKREQGIKKAARQEASISQLRALTNLGPLKIKELHDDGDVTVQSGGKNFVVTTDGSKFKEIQKALQPHHLSSIVDATKKFGGSSTTINGDDAAELAKQGKFGRYFVGAYPHHSEEMPEAEFNETRLGTWVDQHKDLLSLPHHAIGTWKDKQGKVVLDIARGVNDLQDVHKLGAQHKQQEIYDAVAGESIPVRALTLEKGFRDIESIVGHRSAELIPNEPSDIGWKDPSERLNTRENVVYDISRPEAKILYGGKEKPSLSLPKLKIGAGDTKHIQNLSKSAWHRHPDARHLYTTPWHKHTFEGAKPIIERHPKTIKRIARHTHAPGGATMQDPQYKRLIGNESERYDERYRSMNRWDKEPIQPFQTVTGGYHYEGLRGESPKTPYKKMPPHIVEPGDVKPLQNLKEDYYDAYTHPRTVKPEIDPKKLWNDKFWGIFKPTYAPLSQETSRTKFYPRSKASKTLRTLPELSFNQVRSPIQNASDESEESRMKKITALRSKYKTITGHDVSLSPYELPDDEEFDYFGHKGGTTSRMVFPPNVKPSLKFTREYSPTEWTSSRLGGSRLSNIQNSDEPEYYEPWQPKKGDKVKIRVSPECPYTSKQTSLPQLHESNSMGKLGEVTGVNRHSSFVGHHYEVQVHHPENPPEDAFSHENFAAVELEPLDKPVPSKFMRKP